MTAAATVNAMVKDGSVISLDLQLHSEDGRSCVIEFKDLNGLPSRAEGSDYFKAMQQMRERLEGQGCQLLCNGARIDVWPSRMARDMALGKKAYIMCIGQKPSKDDLVDIFEQAPPETVGSVERQRAFWAEWQEWLREYAAEEKERASGT